MCGLELVSGRSAARALVAFAVSAKLTAPAEPPRSGTRTHPAAAASPGGRFRRSAWLAAPSAARIGGMWNLPIYVKIVGALGIISGAIIACGSIMALAAGRSPLESGLFWIGLAIVGCNIVLALCIRVVLTIRQARSGADPEDGP